MVTPSAIIYLNTHFITMLKSLKYLAIAAIAVISLASCSGTPKQLDVQGIQAFTEKKGSDVTEADYDFLIDQLEILHDQTEGMSKEEASAFLDSLPKEQQEAAMVVALALGFGQDNLTEAQKQRLADLEKE